jgi:high-affinity iron transporter
MLASLIIVFREVFEAGLIVGIVLAATRGIGHRGTFIAYGVGAGIVGASGLAYFAGALSDALAGRGQEVFNASILALAAAMLGWHNLWMASHGRELTRELKAMGKAVAAGDKSLAAMMIVVAIAVLREGAEVVLFMYGIAASSTEGWPALLVGAVLGIALGATVSFLLYLGLVAIPVHRLFFVTSWLIAVVAAGMAGQAVATLASIDLIPSWGYELWDTSWLLPLDSIPGRALHALVGYSDRPMGVQLAAYLVVLGGLIIGGRLIEGRPARPASSSPQPRTELR